MPSGQELGINWVLKLLEVTLMEDGDMVLEGLEDVVDEAEDALGETVLEEVTTDELVLNLELVRRGDDTQHGALTRRG